jgi:hypothetical protein
MAWVALARGPIQGLFKYTTLQIIKLRIYNYKTTYTYRDVSEVSRF